MSEQVSAKRAPTLHDLLTNEYGVDTHRSPDTKVVSVGTAVVQLVGNNPNRVGLTFINLSPNTIFIYIENSVGPGNGILLAANGGSMSLDWRTDFDLVANEWYAKSTAAASNLQILDVVTQ